MKHAHFAFIPTEELHQGEKVICFSKQKKEKEEKHDKDLLIHDHFRLH